MTGSGGATCWQAVQVANPKPTHKEVFKTFIWFILIKNASKISIKWRMRNSSGHFSFRHCSICQLFESIAEEREGSQAPY